MATNEEIESDRREIEAEENRLEHAREKELETAK